MGLRIPLPKQVEKVHKDKSKYDRKALDKVYSDDRNQPTVKYMKGLKKVQAKALKVETAVINKSITEFFNPYCMEHMKAYESLCKTGMWPIGFILGDMEFPSGWQIGITAKIASAWLELAKAGQVNGIPGWE